MDKAIEAEHLSKIYRLYGNNKDRLKEMFRFYRKEYLYKEYHALEDISFSIFRGETVGIIGTNGSGKSTVLKIIAGVLNATSGEVKVHGRISALLELGAGFNMEYSGIDNIYLNGMMLGLTKEEVDEKISKIIEFAEIGDFVFQPVKTYSSGMFARLAFAVSIHVDPDILIIDEALSVGDMYFQEKCFEQMKKMVRSGATILFVSHSLPAVRNFCKRVIWLEQGKMKMQGPAEMVCEAYKKYLDEKNENTQIQSEMHQADVTAKVRNKICISSVELNKDVFYTDEDIELSVGLEIRIDHPEFGLGIIIRDSRGEIVTLFNTIRDDLVLKGKIENVKLVIPNHDFLEGTYYISVNVCDEMVMYPYDNEEYIKKFRVNTRTNQSGLPLAEGRFRAKHRWVYAPQEK